MFLFGSFIITQLELQYLPLHLPDKEVCIRLSQNLHKTGYMRLSKSINSNHLSIAISDSLALNILLHYSVSSCL